jgi:hypothetical protein
MNRLRKGVADASVVSAACLVGERELSDASSTLTRQCSSALCSSALGSSALGSSALGSSALGSSRQEHFQRTRTIRVPAQKPFRFQHFELMRNARGRGQANCVAHLSDARRIAAPFDSVLDHFQDATLPKRQTVGVDRAVWK